MQTGAVMLATEDVPNDAHHEPEVILDLTFDDETLVLDTLRELIGSVAQTLDDFTLAF